MDNPTPSLREQGIQALRERQIDAAVDLLARAVMADARDAEAQAFLGVAYSQKGLHAQAKRALLTAVELQPRNAHHRFNLGVALEHAGDRQGAASAYRDTLQLDPEHAQARARARALAVAPSAASPAAARQPAAPPSAPSLSDAPWLRGRQGPVAAHAGPPGTVECPQCHQWSKPGLSCEWCSGTLRSAPMPSQGTSGMTGEYAGAERLGRAGIKDRLDLVQSITDWFQVLVSPGRFFEDQVGREGLKAPLAFLLVYSLLSGLLGMISLTLRPLPGLPPMSGGLGFIVGFAIFAVIGWLMSTLTMLVWAGIVHGICKLFGGQGSYAGTFRATVYALAPMPLFSILFLLLSAASGPPRVPGLGVQSPAIIVPGGAPAHLQFARVRRQRAFSGGIAGRQMYRPPVSPGYGGMPTGPAAGSPLGAMTPLILLAFFVAGIVYLIFMGIGVAHIHGVGPGAAVGVVIISGVVAFVLYLVIVVVLGVLLAAILVGMRGAAR
jgi:hypothetical protein